MKENKRQMKSLALASWVLFAVPTMAMAQKTAGSSPNVMGMNYQFDARLYGKKLSLQQCFELANQQNLELQAGRKSVERAKVMQGTAWDVDKTEIALSQDPSSGGNTDNALSFSQSIEFPTVYAARHGQLKAETQAEKSRVNVLSQQLRSDIASLYYTMLYQCHRMHILTSQDSILHHYKAVADKRYQSGETRQLEVLSAERWHNDNMLEMDKVKSEVENLQVQLMELLNTEDLILPAENDLYVIRTVPQTAYNYRQTADGQYQQDRITALDKEVKVAKAGYAPSLSLSLRSQLVISGWNPYNVDRSRFQEGNFFGFEVGVGVPLFYGATKAKVKAAKKSKEVAELEMQQEMRKKERDYRLCLNRLKIAESRLKYYETESENNAGKIVSLSTTEYENGEISYVEYVKSLQEATDMRLKHADVINEYNEAVLALLSLTNSL